jgi:hypothetical protein
MGKRSRKRSSGGGAAGPVEPPVAPRPVATSEPPRALRRRASLAEAPKAPWAPVPLTELGILAGLVAMVAGWFASAPAVLIGGFALLALAAVELAIREHFAGYRSHTTLIAAACGLVVGGPVALVAPRAAAIGAALVVFAGAFAYLRRIFKDKTGGMAFRA